MSAIWGCIDLKKEDISSQVCDEMQEALQKYKIDSYNKKIHSNSAMGCGLQFIRYNSKQEVLPTMDSETNIMFTMDGMLDNRLELSNILAKGEEMPPDGELLFRAYQKWGRDCNDYLRGSYSFAAYHYRENMLILSADHIFSRALYYCRQGTKIYFGTSIASIIAALPTPPEINNRWISDFLSTDSLRTISEPFETPYNGIKKIGPHRYLIFTADSTKEVIHWDPLSMPELRLKDDNTYKEKYMSLMQEATESITNCDVQMGIYLSSGMDSAAVAAVFAKELDKEKRNLYGYTSVPVSSYKPRINRFQTEDETKGVLALCKMHQNINPSFCPLEGMDALSDFPRILNAYEVPFKSSPNMTWLYAIADKAYNDGCKIMLNGQMGNGTVSWGTIYDLATNDFYCGRPITAIKDISTYCKQNRISRKRMLKDWTEGMFPKLFGNKPPTEQEALKYCLVNPEFSNQNGSVARFNSLLAYNGTRSMFPLSKNREKMMNEIGVTILGEAETKLGLSTGLFIRDITRDKKLWEFCFTAPIECSIRMENGKVRDRRMVRDYMSGLLPPEIAENPIRYGSQSADWIHRLQQHWPEVTDEISKVICNPKFAYCLNANKLADLLDPNQGTSMQEKDHMLTAVMGAYAVALFLSKNKI